MIYSLRIENIVWTQETAQTGMKFSLVITTYIIADYHFISHTMYVNDYALLYLIKVTGDSFIIHKLEYC